MYNREKQFLLDEDFNVVELESESELESELFYEENKIDFDGTESYWYFLK